MVMASYIAVNVHNVFLLCPAVVCPCGLGFSFSAPLSGGAGLESLRSTALRFLGSEGKVRQKFKGKVLYQGNLCYHYAEEESASRTETLGDFFRVRGPKDLFWIVVAKAAA